MLRELQNVLGKGLSELIFLLKSKGQNKATHAHCGEEPVLSPEEKATEGHEESTQDAFGEISRHGVIQVW